jgi:diaminopimelate epimerase
LSVLTLVKYHGLGNDFLLALDGRLLDAAADERADRRAEIGAPGPEGADRVGDLARALCDRHTGVGADGLIVLRPPGSNGDVRMELRNADGRRAETSGNGLRCLALAAVEAGLLPGPELAVETDAGVRRAILRQHDEPGSAYISVEMGRLRVAPSPVVSDPLLPGSPGEPWPSWSVDAGNPHLVVLAPSLEGVAIAAIGPILERLRPGGQNVEIVTRDADRGDELSLLVWERGAGVTLACGTGSAAAAAALHCAGISSAQVRVHNPGGTAEVTLSGDDPFSPFAELAGAVHRVARIEVDPTALGASEVVVVAS